MIKILKSMQIRIDLLLMGLWILLAGLIAPHFVTQRLIKANFKKIYDKNYRESVR